jgi:hypothetical protein
VGTVHVIPQGSIGIFYSDSTSLFVAPTSLSLIDGTAAQPALSFISSPGTGIFYSTGTLAIAINGTAIGALGVNGTASALAVSSAGGIGALFISDDTQGNIRYNNNNVLGFSPAGNVSVSNGQLLLTNGLSDFPSLAFTSSPGTGLSYSTNTLGISINGNPVGLFEVSGTATLLAVSSAGEIPVVISSDDTICTISYNFIPALHISPLGIVTFPTNPAATLNSLMPTATAGSIVYYNGTNWVTLTPPSSNDYLRFNTTTHAPFWSAT